MSEITPEVTLEFENIEKNADRDSTIIAYAEVTAPETERRATYEYRVNYVSETLNEELSYYIGDTQVHQRPVLTYDYDVSDGVVNHVGEYNPKRFIRNAVHNNPKGVLTYAFTQSVPNDRLEEDDR